MRAFGVALTRSVSNMIPRRERAAMPETATLDRSREASNTTACGLIQACCVCELTASHDGPHECECGGSWDFRPDGTFVVVAFPGETA